MQARLLHWLVWLATTVQQERRRLTFVVRKDRYVLQEVQNPRSVRLVRTRTNEARAVASHVQQARSVCATSRPRLCVPPGRIVQRRRSTPTNICVRTARMGEALGWFGLRIALLARRACIVDLVG